MNDQKLNEEIEILNEQTLHTESSEVLDDIDTIGGVPVKKTQPVLTETGTSLPLITPEEQMEADKWEAINVYTKAKSKKKIIIAITILLALLLALIAYFTIDHFNRFKNYESIKTIKINGESFPTLANIKKLKIKNVLKRNNYQIYTYWSLNKKDIDKYQNYLLANGYFKGVRERKKIFVKAANSKAHLLLIEIGYEDIAFRKTLSYVTEFELDIFSSYYKDYKLAEYGSDNLIKLKLPDNFEEVYKSDELISLKGDIIKTINISKLVAKTEDEAIKLKHDDLVFNGYQIKREDDDKIYRIDSYNQTISLWNSSYILKNNDNFIIIEIIKANRDDYLDKIILEMAD